MTTVLIVLVAVFSFLLASAYMGISLYQQEDNQITASVIIKSLLTGALVSVLVTGIMWFTVM